MSPSSFKFCKLQQLQSKEISFKGHIETMWHVDTFLLKVKVMTEIHCELECRALTVAWFPAIISCKRTHHSSIDPLWLVLNLQFIASFVSRLKEVVLNFNKMKSVFKWKSLKISQKMKTRQELMNCVACEERETSLTAREKSNTIVIHDWILEMMTCEKMFGVFN